jgi:SAM-dependent methyltransferase
VTDRTVYDEHAQFYIDFIDSDLGAERSFFRVLLDVVVGLLGDRLAGARVLDVACGEGYVSRSLVTLGAREVVGIDISEALIAVAQERVDSSALAFHVDDAHELSTLGDASFDVAVSQMALMDIPDVLAMFRAVHRVLKPDGAFVMTLLHPAFESPHHIVDEPPRLLDHEGTPTAVVVRRYRSEGHWQSGASGVRGHVGSHHRMLSTYLNDLIAAGFRVMRVEEPVMPVEGLLSRVPRVLVISAVRAS